MASSLAWLPVWRRNTKPARWRAARTSLPERSVGSLAMQWIPTLCGLDFNKLFADLGGNRVACVATILDVQLDRFADIRKGFLPRVALGDASGQSRDADDVTAIGFLFQDYSVTNHTGYFRMLCRTMQMLTENQFDCQGLVVLAADPTTGTRCSTSAACRKRSMAAATAS